MLLTSTPGMAALAELPMLLLHRASLPNVQLERTPGRLQLHLSTNVPVSLHWVLEMGPSALELCVAL